MSWLLPESGYSGMQRKGQEKKGRKIEMNWMDEVLRNLDEFKKATVSKDVFMPDFERKLWTKNSDN